MRGAVTAVVGIGALLTGYLWGYGVGEREGQDSDPDSYSGEEVQRIYEKAFETGAQYVITTTPQLQTPTRPAWENGG